MDDKLQTMLLSARDKIQKDVLSILDGLDSEILDNVCDAIVDRFKVLIDYNKGRC